MNFDKKNHKRDKGTTNSLLDQFVEAKKNGFGGTYSDWVEERD